MKSRAASGSILALVIAVSVGCASSGASGTRGAGNVLTYEDLIETRESDLQLAIQRLRPRWLTPRGQTSTGRSVMLFVDGTPRGDMTELQGMLVANTRDVTYLSASEAAFRFGTIAGSGGALAVRTRR